MGPLSGIRVLDLSFWAPGRWGTMILGDLGADVICVEIPRRPDSRNRFREDDTNIRWLMYQRNKRSVTLNLACEPGKRVFERLARKADVIIESYKPGTAAKLGVDYQTVSKVNPGIVYCSVSGFGQTGPYSQLIGHEPNYQGMAGALFQNRPLPGEPQMLPVLVGDLAGGATNALIAILAALLHKRETGKGQHVDVSITAGIVHFLGIFPFASWAKDEHRKYSYTTGMRADFRAYRTRDGRYVAVSPSEPAHWERFCRAIGREDLIELYETTTRRQELVGALSDVFQARDQSEWVSFNAEHNIAVTPVLETIEEIEDDPQFVHRGLFQEVEYEPLGRVKQVATPFLMSETPPEIRFMPRFGQHTREVMLELGYTDEQIGELRTAGACE
jgi:crotonobetainyl-CoA:carnitine CoA-transferase CaiB-like acyl-CoA transferase